MLKWEVSASILVSIFAHIYTRPEEHSSRPAKLGLIDNMKLKTNIWPTSELVDTARTYAADRDYETAIVFVSKAIDRKPYMVSYYVLRAEFKMSMQRYREAFRDLQEGFEAWGRQKVLDGRQDTRLDHHFTASSLLEYGDQFMQQNEFECALWFYTKAIEMTPGESQHYIQRAKCYLKQGKTFESVMDLEEAIRITPNDYDAISRLDDAYYKAVQKLDNLNYQKLTSLGSRLIARRKFYEAILCYDKAIQKQPNTDAECYKQRGICHQELEHFGLAIEDYVQYLRMTSNNDLNTWRQLMKLCSMTGKLKLALNELNALDTDKLELLAQYYEDQREIAILLFTKMIKKDPNNAQYFRKRGNYYAQANDLEAAIKDFYKVRELEPNNWQDAADLFKILYEAGKYDEAIAAIKSIDDLQMGRKLCDQFRNDENLDGAIKCYSLMIEKYSKDSQLFRARAQCYRKLKIFDKAVNDLMQAAFLKPNDTSVQNELDEVLNEQEQVQDIPPEPVLDLVVFDPAEAAENEKKVVKKIYSNKYLEDLMLLDMSQSNVRNTAEEFGKAESSQPSVTGNQTEVTQTAEPSGAQDLISFTTSYPAPVYNAPYHGWELVPVDPFDTVGQNIRSSFQSGQEMAIVPVNPFLVDEPPVTSTNAVPVAPTNPFATDLTTTPGNGVADVPGTSYNPFA